MGKDLVTVVIPVYNVEAYLKECLDSIVNQSYENLEILAVNDGSTDSSLMILEGYAAKDSRITILNKENGGLSDARNYGISHAHGETICFIDGDDVIDRDFVYRLKEALDASNADIAVSDMCYFYEDGHTEESDGGNFRQGSVRETPSLIRINNSACNKLYKTFICKEVAFPKGKLYEDLATEPIYLYLAKSIIKVNAPLYRYRQRQGSIQHVIDRKVFDIYDAIDRVKAYVQTHGNEENVLKEVQTMYCVYGLDITTLKIKDYADPKKMKSMLKENMEHLTKRYPNYKKDPFVQGSSWKKKLIYTMLDKGYYDTVLKLYGK